LKARLGFWPARGSMLAEQRKSATQSDAPQMGAHSFSATLAERLRFLERILRGGLRGDGENYDSSATGVCAEEVKVRVIGTRKKRRGVAVAGRMGLR
jgi:hypothetical protein